MKWLLVDVTSSQLWDGRLILYHAHLTVHNSAMIKPPSHTFMDEHVYWDCGCVNVPSTSEGLHVLTISPTPRAKMGDKHEDKSMDVGGSHECVNFCDLCYNNNKVEGVF